MLKPTLALILLAALYSVHAAPTDAPSYQGAPITLSAGEKHHYHNRGTVTLPPPPTASPQGGGLPHGVTSAIGEDEGGDEGGGGLLGSLLGGILGGGGGAGGGLLGLGDILGGLGL